MTRRYVRLALCVLLLALGGTVLLGWSWDIPALKSLVPGLPSMKVNTAFCFILTGAGIAGAEARRAAVRYGAALAALILIVVGALTLAQYLGGYDFGIDQALITDTGTLRGSGHPGRMSPLTASGWLVLGPMILLLAFARTRSAIILAHSLVGYVAFVSFLAACGYAFGAEAFWGIGAYTTMAVHTAVGLLVAAAAALMTRADEGWLAGFRGSPDARALLVDLLPLSLFLPLCLGFVILLGSAMGAYNSAFGFALFVPSMALTLMALALRVAHRVRSGELALRQSESALRVSEERLSTALGIARLGTFEWNVLSDAVLLDARSREIFGFAPGEGQSAEQIFERIHPDDLQRVLAEARRSRDAMARLETEYRIVLPDGTIRTIVSFNDVGGNGRAECIFGVFGDISERKRLEEDLRQLNETLEERVRERSDELERVHEQLRQSQKLEAMGQLTGGVAHDFNNLLSPIIGSLDMIQRRGVDGERTQRLIEGALASAERAKTLVQRLLAFARRQPLQATAVDLGHLLGNIGELIASTCGPRIRLVMDVDPELPHARADANQLEMALLNLAVNARDAMPDGGTLTISAGVADVAAGDGSKLLPGRYVRLAVVDTGAGMDEATLERAIEPFFSTKGIGKGTGLGLSMVHGLAAQLGGELRLQSRSGVGTSVELWLPSSEIADPASARSHISAAMAASGTALLVDDEEIVRTSTTHMLLDLGYHVVQASSAEEALERLDAGLSPDVVITDHLMPGMTGTDLARLLKSRCPGIPVLIISGYAAVEDVAPDLKRLAKPFRQSDISAALAALSVAAE